MLLVPGPQKLPLLSLFFPSRLILAGTLETLRHILDKAALKTFYEKRYTNEMHNIHIIRINMHILLNACYNVHNARVL